MDYVSDKDMEELWDSDFNPNYQELFRSSSADAELPDWSAPMLDAKPIVILHDRLMTDAALGAPIKTEHSYSLAADNNVSRPGTPVSIKRIEDTDEDYFPAISMNTATGKCQKIDVVSLSDRDSPLNIKDEPLSSPASPESCPMSPDSSDDYIIHSVCPKKRVLQKATPRTNAHYSSSRGTYSNQERIIMPKLSIKVESATAGFQLPPTPPSSTSSDSESVPSEATELRRTSRLYLTSSTSSRQPIHTPLISNQPKGSTGVLTLTEEEKRTLLAEGYPVPTRLPLTKQEEKSLKKIRRKIKNKISAQESRRKKKEYMDTLERKVETLESENVAYKKRVELLEADNSALLQQLRKLQAELKRADIPFLTQFGSRSVIK